MHNSFIFTHIPKCGGTSFRKYIYDAGIQSGLDPSSLYIPGQGDVPFSKNIISVSEEELKAIQIKPWKLMACHAYFDVHRQYHLNMDQPCYYTILREPISRVLSHHNHFLFKEHDTFKNKSLMELEPDRLDEALQIHANLQTLYITNTLDRSGVHLNLEDLNNAKQILKNNYICFGILEHIQTSIHLLDVCSPAWLQLRDEFPHANKNVDSKGKLLSISDEVMERIRHHNRIDIELYNFAVEIFHARCERRNIPL